ncbi:MAG: hypothetical protein M1830_007136 [Pleopsidium flavum]|nr:MAG: hypothetical protein M1830_007136 [Pleopsidium flavum]
MTSATAFRLEPSLFNANLYANINTFWFADLPVGATAPTQGLIFRWYGVGTKDENEAFDQSCSRHFKTVLDSIGPEKLLLPPFTTYEDDREKASIIAAPFLSELYPFTDDYKDDEQGPRTALSMILLLDQLPRNVYRTTNKHLIFEHYDRLARALLLSLLDDHTMAVQNSERRVGRFDLHPSFLHHPVYRAWFYMPLTHSEHLPYHSLLSTLISSLLTDAQQAEDEPATKYIEAMRHSERQHAEIIERFGRYPYRNTVLGRDWTEQERAWLEAGGNTFGS